MNTDKRDFPSGMEVLLLLGIKLDQRVLEEEGNF